ncbi:DUF2844 domain-containing protein [Paraburkholderia sp. SARCC-3016]|uniref:DUF2844 domain-containing protein n=1 Tax=Paraburkholderia sp. SARCC-3016 TaxID=3058611 RepID=UPI0028065EA5|nr:DUF2844 domain-containing protein [Paraburkholderia sp. SARCC-3016]MDQ7979404.1 DUF2844 domain-containing protein [Paraburkholderia sp. SARCC-3016]
MNFAITLRIMRRGVVLAAGSAAILIAAPARAQLGGTMPATAQAGSAAVANHLADASIRIRAWTDEGGTTIHEYATGDGLIFAYTWEGPTMPNLDGLLGRYSGSYRAKAAELAGSRASLHASRVVQPDVIVDSGGQMRSYVGRAWLPAAIPPGISPSDLQ